jgi:light-regulated signal transduction histidine kinase (bacteriophytochrome)
VGSRGGELRPTDADAALTSALANVQPALDESAAVIRRSPLPAVFADPAQLVLVFQNLLGNAIKFRNGARPEISVACEETPGEWRFTVRDNGIGIDPKHAERIFQVFQRLHAKKEYAGTGIGLAICKKIAERHGGRIWVVSEPGQGAAFHFTILRNGGQKP